MLQLDNISLLSCDDSGHFTKLTRLIRKQYRYSKDSVTENKSLLNNGRHGNDIHVSTAQDRYDPFVFHIQML